MQNISFDKELLAANVAKRFLKFLEDFKIIDNTTNEEDKVYIRQAESMRTMDKATMQVDFHHILNYDSELAEAILSQHYRFEPFLRKTLQHFMFNLYPDLNNQKTFDISFFGLSSLERIRDLKTDKIGKLTAITGTVTRTTEVRPELLYGSFMCLSCHTENKDIEQQFKYTEPRRCRNPKCDNHTRWEISLEGSTFGDWQKIRIQEHANEIPTGGMPRSIDVVLRNEMVDVAKPGDRCTFVGSLVVVPEIMSLLKPGERVQLNTRGEGLRRQGIKPLDGVTGLKQLGVRDLNYKMVFLACHARPTENAFAISEDIADDKLIEHLTNDEKQEILRLKDEPQLYKRLAKSICPSVHGHEEIKKGILLMLFGGVNKTTMEGMKLRGDINVCVVGDPSVAKSQFLKWVCSFLPRSVYTSGRATSAAGLTAAVQRDPDTGEFCLEAGALMLADHGVCCIDEFDKMDPKDQVAIHEAMEQQTISIAKAGIRATLNAKCSILAAANPVFGRYDKTRSLKHNLNISAPIMSRFDLFFIVLDECNEFSDYAIAQHIVNMHRDAALFQKPEIEAPLLQRYIRFCKSLQPKMTKEAAFELRKAFVGLRANDLSYTKSAYQITIRQLESLIRLSEALAKLHCSLIITPEFVKEAARLLSNSILKVEKPDIEIEPQEVPNLDVIPGSDEQKMIEEEIGVDKEPEQKKARLKLTYDEYERLGRRIIQYVRDQERQGIEVIQNNIANWYLTEEIQNIQTEEELNRTTKIIHSVIHRLITQERTLTIAQDNADYHSRVLQLHPNFLLSE